MHRLIVNLSLAILSQILFTIFVFILEYICFQCDSGGTQTPDFQNRNLTFYSAELRGQINFSVQGSPFLKIRGC